MAETYVLQPDYARFEDLLTPSEIAMRNRVRSFVQNRIQPRIADCWESGTFPFDIVPGLAALGVLDELRP